MKYTRKHEQYQVLEHYASRQWTNPRGCGAVYLYGGAGGGKTSACEQLALEVSVDKGREFLFCLVQGNRHLTTSQIVGFIDANGIWRKSSFAHVCLNGGVALFDEVANCSASGLTPLNPIIANRLFPGPDGVMYPCHPDLIVVMADNTCGRGPTHQFPDRVKLDSASLDRCAMVQWRVDWSLVRGIGADMVSHLISDLVYQNLHNVLCKWFQDCSQWIADPSNGIKSESYFTPRSYFGLLEDIICMPQVVRDTTDLLDVWPFKGLAMETRKRILDAKPFPHYAIPGGRL